MPNLEEFQAGSGQINISDRGAESEAQAGRRAGVAFSQLGGETEKTYDVYHQHQVDMDTTNTYTQSSVAHANGIKQLMTLVNDPRAADHPEMGQALVDQYSQAQNDIASHASTDEGRKLGARLAAERIDQFQERVASEMSVLAGNKAVQNFQTQTATSRSIVSDDPSQLPHELAVLDDYYATNAPHNLNVEGVGKLGEAHLQAKAETAMTAFMSSAISGRQQIADGKPETIITAAEKMLTSGVADDLPGFNKAEVMERLEQARTEGATQNEQRLRYGQEQVKQDGYAEYAKIDAALEPYKNNGQTPPPDLVSAVADFGSKYGRYIPGEAHTLNELLGTVTNPNASFEKSGASVAGAASLEQRILTGDRTVDENALNAALAAGAQGKPNGISIEQYKVLKGLMPPKGTEANPAMRQAMTQLNQRITELTGSLPQGQSRGEVAAILRHDMTSAFEGWSTGQFKDDPLKALDVVTNINNPHNAMQLIQNYRAAVNQPDPAAYLKQRLHGFQSAGYGAAEGSVVSPITGPTAGAPQPAAQAAPASTSLSPERMDALTKLAGGH